MVARLSVINALRPLPVYLFVTRALQSGTEVEGPWTPGPCLKRWPQVPWISTCQIEATGIFVEKGSASSALSQFPIPLIDCLSLLLNGPNPIAVDFGKTRPLVAAEQAQPTAHRRVASFIASWSRPSWPFS